MGRCVFFIKMLHSINPICRKDTGGDPGTQLRELSLLSLGPVLFPSSENRSPQPRFLSTWLPFPGKGEKKKKLVSSVTSPGKATKGCEDLCETSLRV